MYSYLISRAFRVVLIISAVALLGFSAISALACLGFFAMLKGGSLSVLVHTTANAVGPILLNLVSCAFLVKKANELKTKCCFSGLALFSQVISILGLFLAIPWLYQLMSASYSWQAHMLYGLDTPFAFWVYILAVGIILHEFAQMPPFKNEMKQSEKSGPEKSDDPGIQSLYNPQIGVDKDILFP